MNPLKNRLFIAALAVIAVGALAGFGYVDPSVLALAPFAFSGVVGDIETAPAKLLRANRQKRDELLAASNAITTAASSASLDLTAEQQTAIAANLSRIKELDAEAGNLSALIEATRAAPAKTGSVVETHLNVLDDPKRGFASLGDFARAVYNANPNVQGGFADPRLTIQAATPGGTYASENVGVDGGYLVPTEFSTQIAKLSLDSDAFLPLCDSIPVSGNSVTFPSDETTPWGSNGVRAYWAAEATQATATKPVIKPNTMRLNKLFGLVPVTDELLADSPAVSAYLTGLLGRSIKWKVNDALVNGTGAGQPLGFAQGAGLAVISKESSQTGNTLVAANIAKMYAAMPVDYLGNAVWLITPDQLPQLMTMTIGNFSIWTPPMQGFANAPGGFLFGKPIIPTQTCQAAGSQGDIYFVNFQAYRTISKDGVQIAQSMHLYFDADSTAFRATFRVDGQPTFKQTITQARASQALSPYVALQARP